MKRIPILLSSLIFSFSALAQAPFPTRDSMNVNHINASVLLHGDMWWDPTAEVASCFFPSTTRKNIGFTSGIWMSGYDAMGTLHVAAQTYRQDGNDYWPGPLDAAGSLSYATSNDWAKFFRVTQTDIQTFLSLSTHTVANTPPSILTWPATGNSYATGYAGATLTIPAGTDMAPFNDVNSNGIYEPLLGDYPKIKGDESLWWTFSDNGPTHTQTNGVPLGIEVHVLNYAYSRNTLIDNVVFYEYTVINRSPNIYNNFRLALHADMDLGFYNNDYIGFDSAHRTGIVYQGNPYDGSSTGTSPSYYGYNAPVAGTTLLELPGDTGTYKIPAGAFNFYTNDVSITGNPTVPLQYDNYMRGKNRPGTPRFYDYAGPGLPPATTGPTVNYVYPGDPSDTSQWSECSQGLIPGDMRYIIASNDLTLLPGGTLKIAMALIVTDTNQGGCPNVSFHDINVVADTAWAVYRNPLTPVSVAINNVNVAPAISLYPNPATNVLTAELSGNTSDITFDVLNSLGQVMPVTFTTAGTKATANIEALPAGMYLLRCSNGTSHNTAHFVKR